MKKSPSQKQSSPKTKYYLLGFLVLVAILAIVFFTQSTNKVAEENTANPVAVFETSAGTFKIELYEDKSPITAGNFKKLVEEGFYDGVRFHRTISNFMIQGGDPKSKDEALRNEWGTGNPGYFIDDEFIEGFSNVRGTISMANSGRANSGGSQFFINVVDNTGLDYDKQPLSSKHPVFGVVVEGMDVVDSIANNPTNPSFGVEDYTIINRAYIE